VSSGNYSFFGDWFFGNINATPTGNGTSFYYAFTESKKVAKPGQEEDNWVRWLTFVQFDVTCESDEDGAPFLLVSALISETAFEFNESQVFADIYNKEASVSVTLECNCIGSSSLFCAGDPSNVGSKGCHIPGDVTIEWDNDGITVGGTNYSWVPTPGFDQIRIGDYWEEEGVFPSSGSVTLKRDNACDPGECDCNASVVGMIVEFAGEEFVLNTDAFIGTIEPNGTTWSHVSGTKIFSRVDYSECTVQEVLTEAELFCQDDEWFVTFTRQCAELTNSGCTGVGLRSAQWVGRLVCDEEGRPVGEPFDVQLDSDDEGADCSIGTPPFFRISAPP
jgi:hypothetical protein